MMNNVKTQCGSFSNAVPLSLSWKMASEDILKTVQEVCERFLHAAAQLPQSEYLGWQIKMKNFRSRSFASPQVRISPDDYKWIFSPCIRTASAGKDSVDALYKNSEKLYCISVTDGTSDEIGRYKGSFFREGGFIAASSDETRDKLIQMMSEEDAVLRFIAGAASDQGKDHGMIVLSLPEEISLRMLALFSLAFPNLAIRELELTDHDAEENHSLPDSVFLEVVSMLLYSITYRKKDEPDISEGEESCEDDDPSAAAIPSDLPPDFDKHLSVTKRPESISVEELDLSIRSLNCLKRAGISTVGQLQALAGDELKMIRNLGRSSIEEIRRKLSEFSSVNFVSSESESCIKKLDELIGLNEVKEQIRKIAAFAKMKQDMALKDSSKLSMSLNMEFVGSPGTAKTTVARIAAGVFHEIGLLCSGELVEVGRADLIAEYEGQTAVKVKKVFDDARGKVLFIDEAYSLVEHLESCYGDEAISTIVQEMENRRDETIVIFAGYPDKMEEFFSRNPGLRSRVPFRIRFNDYNTDEMVEISESEAKKRGFEIDAEAREKLAAACSKVSGQKNSGNGRFCRNLIESAILSYAFRVYAEDAQNPDKDFRLTKEDIEVPNFTAKPGTNPIGFVPG